MFPIFRFHIKVLHLQNIFCISAITNKNYIYKAVFIQVNLYNYILYTILIEEL